MFHEAELLREAAGNESITVITQDLYVRSNFLLGTGSSLVTMDNHFKHHLLAGTLFVLTRIKYNQLY